MTREQKIKLIELIQEYFEEKDEESLATYGYMMPLFELREMISLALFNKYPDKACDFNHNVHKHIYQCVLTDEEKALMNEEFKTMVLKGALTLTKSKKAVKVSNKIITYNK